MNRKDFEIMAPVGSWESLYAAHQGGADAIYFGIEGLNMRSRSSVNFTLEDEHDHSYCDHEHGHCEHEHHHDHDEHDEHEHHHHHHHADEVFTSWGRETTKQFTEEEIRNALAALDDALEYGIILRAKGIVPATDGRWIHFDHVPGEIDVRYGSADVIGKLCVIGSKIDEAAIAELFGV